MPAPTAYKPVYQPWSAGWRNYCASKYRSFNPRTGT
ncbi:MULTISPECIES: BA14K family protein [Bartonella]|nr:MULTISPECIES: BA14K family protein [Bartonella]